MFWLTSLFYRSAVYAIRLLSCWISNTDALLLFERLFMVLKNTYPSFRLEPKSLWVVAPSRLSISDGTHAILLPHFQQFKTGGTLLSNTNFCLCSFTTCKSEDGQVSCGSLSVSVPFLLWLSSFCVVLLLRFVFHFFFLTQVLFLFSLFLSLFTV